MTLRRVAVLCLVAAAGVAAEEPTAAILFKQGKKAEKAGDVVNAYLRYSEAAAKDPSQAKYWAKSQALRTRAALKAKPMPMPVAASADTPPTGPEEGGVTMALTAADLADLRRLRPPPELKPKPGRQSLDLKGDSKSVFTQAAHAFGLDTVFDGDYQAGSLLRIRIDDADYREALRALEAATGSFIVPLGERLFMVVKDTTQKRAEMEPVVAISIPIPPPVTVQEAQDLARTVQQALEIQKAGVDADHHMVVMKDRLSKVRPAQALFEQLLHSRPMVGIQMQFLEVDRSTLISYGLLLPNSFPITFLGTTAGTAGALQSLAKFLFGHPMFGLGIADAGLFSNMTKSLGKNLLEAEVRSLDGSTATFHVGDKYPISTAQFLGRSYVPPTFNFEDLGLSLKVTPHVHGMEEVTLEVNAEFKLLSGQSANGIPVISNRKLESKVRLRMGEWAIVAGLMTTSEARSVSGVAGLSTLPLLGPLFRRNDVNNQTTDVVLVLKPELLSLPATEFATKPLFLGSEARPNTPL